MSDVCGRFAPSPSGRMHLGNVFCALLAWLSARAAGGRFVLRIEDLDPQRCKPEYARLLEEDLAWLGLNWDEGGRKGGEHGPYFQSACSALYEAALQKISERARVYPCFCMPQTRRIFRTKRCATAGGARAFLPARQRPCAERAAPRCA